MYEIVQPPCNFSADLAEIVKPVPAVAVLVESAANSRRYEWSLAEWEELVLSDLTNTVTEADARMAVNPVTTTLASLLPGKPPKSIVADPDPLLEATDRSERHAMVPLLSGADSVRATVAPDVSIVTFAILREERRVPKKSE